ncbi:MAG: CusA/CzcA family heavy metal efflux RND transporter, partial [Sphingobacteriaceae bacterium]|nr:CusA/CzcA family heavy metal efflux RND transporter [Cytophagaceae bacterium]
PAIRAALRVKGLVVGASVVLMAVAIWFFTTLGGEFIPTLEEGDFVAETQLLTGSSLSQTVDKITQASDLLMKKFPEVTQVIGKIGAAEIPTDPMPMESCDLTIKLKPKDEWTTARNREDLADAMTEALEAIPGVNFGISQPIQFRSNELISGVRQDIGIKIFGEDLDELSRLAQQVAGLVGSVDGAVDLYQEHVVGLPQIIVSLNRAKIAQFGLDIETVNRAISTAFAGEVAGLVYEGEKRFDLVVRFAGQSRQRIEDVQNLYVTTPDGSQVPLNQLAEVSLKLGPNQIQREDAKRRIIVGFNVRGRDIESVVEELQTKIGAQVKFPPGYFVTYGGQFENLQKATGRLAVAVPVALLLIFVLLYFTFGSIGQSLLIFTAIPMAAIGGVFALLLRGMPFSISAGVGFIALFGVAVLNGIVLIGEFNFLKKEGEMNLNKIIFQGTQTRLRPILMTALVASLGFLPMALSQGAGGEVQKPLATVVIGGLVTSTLLTLFVIPVLYIYFERGFRVRKKAVVAAFLLLAPFFTQAQTPLALGDAVQTALQRNSGVEAARREVEVGRTLRGTVREVPKTGISALLGQYNSYKFDQNLSISQTFPAPGVFRARSQLADATLRSGELQLSLTETELAYQVKAAWYEWAYFSELQRFFRQQDSLYGAFARAASVRFRTGETGSLEQTIAQTRLRQVQTQRRQNEADLGIARRRLQTLLQTEALPNLRADSLTARPLPRVDTAGFAANPVLLFFTQQVRLAEAEKALQQAARLPDFTLGYFNQSLIGTPKSGNSTDAATALNRFQGVQVGIGIPIFGKPYRARIQAAELTRQVQQSRLTLRQRTLEGDVATALAEASKFRESLDYYQSAALPQARELIRQANRSFSAGEIGYVEFLQALGTGNEIQIGYLQTLNDYNQAVLRLELTLGLR